MKSKRVRTDVLEIAYEEHGPEDGAPVILLHGFPYDVRAFDEVAPAAGRRRLPRAGALPARLRPDALPVGGDAALGRAGGAGPRPAAVHGRARHRPRGPGRLRLGRPRRLHRRGAVARARALPGELHRLQHPEHRRLGRAGRRPSRSTASGTSTTSTPSAAAPASPRTAATSAGCCGSCGRRNGRFDEATFEKSAVSFDNPDFVEVVIQSYRHRYGYAPGDPALAGIEAELRAAAQDRRADHQPAWRPRRRRPGAGTDGQAKFFTGPYERRLLPRIGHNVPQEAPAATVSRPARPHERNRPSEQHRPDRRHRKHRQPHPRRSALRRKHTVTAITRDPRKLTARAGMTIRAGSTTDAPRAGRRS